MPSRRRILPTVEHTIRAWLLPALLLLAAGAGLAAPSPAHALPRLAQCANNLDDDGDGKIDFPQEPGCATAADNAETDPARPTACADGLDNDADGKIDFPQEPGCPSAADNAEADPPRPAPCANGIDDDGDGKVDFPADPDCNWAADREVVTVCSNGIDDDGDGKADFPLDRGCGGVNDANEVDPAECDDGRDNDGDGTLDFDAVPGQTADPDCASAADTVERPTSTPPPPPRPPSARCADGRDNDADGRIDFPADAGCSSAADDDEAGPPVATPPTRLLTPFPIVRVRGRGVRGGVRITLLTVRAPAGSTVSVRCTGRSCPRKRWSTRAGRRIVRVRRFERTLRVGTVLQVYVTKPGYLGKYTRFRFTSRGAPLRADRCVKTPGSKPRACPAS